jgi:HD-like signal output (HDOD) protein
VRDVSRASNRSSAPSEEVLGYIFDSWHERIGVQVAEEWSLPEEIVDILGHHHFRPDRGFEPPGALVAVANHICHTSGELGSLAGLVAVEAAGLSDSTLRDLAAALPEMVEEIGQRLA